MYVPNRVVQDIYDLGAIYAISTGPNANIAKGYIYLSGTGRYPPDLRCQDKRNNIKRQSKFVHVLTGLDIAIKDFEEYLIFDITSNSVVCLPQWHIEHICKWLNTEEEEKTEHLKTLDSWCRE